MTISAGSHLGSYKILSPLGGGGMGAVWKARDTKLGRDVAIKVLPAEFAGEEERLTRFEREARLLAALNHPNVAAIYGLEVFDGAPHLVLECVEGETLAERLAAGALPASEALSVCRQIALALEAAHEAGVIHRDLKPSNVKIRPDGSVKVLDFGLAKFVEPEPESRDLSQSPTMTTGGTRTGMILGTAAYMSPEQARGRPLDKRTDIFSFGCVMYECLTGQQAFRGETVSDTLAAILKSEPDWRELPSETPGKVRDLLRRCLEKTRERRLHDIADARLEIEEVLAAPAPECASRGLRACVSRGEHAGDRLGGGGAQPRRRRLRGSPDPSCVETGGLVAADAAGSFGPALAGGDGLPSAALSHCGRDLARRREARLARDARRGHSALSAGLRKTRGVADRGHGRRTQPVLLTGRGVARLLHPDRDHEGFAFRGLPAHHRDGLARRGRSHLGARRLRHLRVYKQRRAFARLFRGRANREAHDPR